MTEVVIGVDPGLDGAVAKVQGGDLEVWDMPTLSVKNKRWVNAGITLLEGCQDLLELLRRHDRNALLTIGHTFQN